MKILNLYCGIGGNRKLWGDDHEITAVELDSNIARIYQNFFPNDIVVVTDAHQYLLDHYDEFDFIWASPPCPSHSRVRRGLGVLARKQNKALYPDMRLYEEILLLQGYFSGKFVVENVISWYQPLIHAIELQRHYFWVNFPIRNITMDADSIEHGTVEFWEKQLGFDLSPYHGIEKRKVLRNCVRPELGLHILNEALNKTEYIHEQAILF